MRNQFAINDRVKIISSEESDVEIAGRQGTIQGMAKDEEDLFWYAVAVDELQDTWYLAENQLILTNQPAYQEVNFTGEVVRVKGSVTHT